MLTGKKIAFIVPSTKKPVARDMAGGYGYLGGDNLILPPLDFMGLAAVVEANNGKAKIFDFSHKSLYDGDPIKVLCKERYDVYIFHISMPSLSQDIEFIWRAETALKSEFSDNFFKVFGYTQLPVKQIQERIMKESPVDACLIGEVEESLPKILKIGMGNGMIYRTEGGDCVMTAPAYIEDLDKLPFPARHLVDHRKYVYDLLGIGVTTMQTSRGCPYGCCYYCPYPAVQGRKWRAKSVSRVLEEIGEIVKLKIPRILFRDAVFTLDRNRTIEICKGIIDANWNISWQCEARANNLDPELLAIMKKAGCKGINIGVETGDEAVLVKTAKPGVKEADFRTLHEAAKKVGIDFHFLLMIGIPGETRHSLHKTFNLITQMKPKTMNVDMITPYPGTKFYEEALSKGWLRATDYELYDGHTPVMVSDKLSMEELMLARSLMIGVHLAMKKPSLFNYIRVIYYKLKFYLFCLGIIN